MSAIELKSRERGTLGRYDDVNRAAVPGDLERQGKRAGGKIVVRHGAVDDPNPAFRGKRQRVAINVHSSALEAERAYGRISEAAYHAGRIYEAIIEASSGSRLGGSGSNEGTDRGSVIVRQLMAIVSSLDRAQRAVDLEADVRRALGRDAEFLLRLVLGESRTFKQVAEANGRTSGRASAEVGHAFRLAVESLAVHWGRTGAPRT